MYYQIYDDFDDDILAVKLDTYRGPIMIATCYLPSRRDTFPLQGMTSLFRKTLPVYMVADLNARYRFNDHNDNNPTGNIINNFINRNLVTYIGPEFNTRVGVRGISRPDIVLRNRWRFLNYALHEGEITSSDHIPVILKLSTSAIVDIEPPRRLIKKADWDQFRTKVNEDRP